MGIANYTNLSELMNGILEEGRSVSISDLVAEALTRKIILASEGELADKSDLENGFIELVNALYRDGVIKPEPADESESRLVQLFESGELAAKGYGVDEGGQVRRCGEVDQVSRAVTVGSAEAGCRNGCAGEPGQRLRPGTLPLLGPDCDPCFNRPGVSPQVVHVPVQGFGQTPVPGDSSSQTAWPTGATSVGIPAFWELETTQSPDVNGRVARQT